MEIIIVILFVIVAFLFYKINLLGKHLSVLSFSEKTINKLLVKKGLIKPSEIDVVINEAIGDMHEDVGNKIIKNAKEIGIIIHEYMDEEELRKYIKEQNAKRINDRISYTDRIIMNDSDL